MATDCIRFMSATMFDLFICISLICNFMVIVKMEKRLGFNGLSRVFLYYFLCLNDAAWDECCVVKNHKVISVLWSPLLEG